MSSARDIENRIPITAGLMLATLMNTLDGTIANVALPHIQGSVSAGIDQITWVLTSYIIATAIMTPLSGWLSQKIGRKTMFLVSIGGFTIASMLCGIATSLPELVAFRILQGIAGASLMPLSQTMILDLYPPEQVPKVMSLWSAAVIVGPIVGPSLGGWLTEQLSWRWVFFINLPIGLMAFLGVWLFISPDRGGRARKFDFLGFGTLVLFIGAIQLMLDRGPSLDWFSAPEIWAELLLALVGLWIFTVHTMTAKQPFFDRALMRDRNFLTASVFGFFIGILLFSTMALLPPMMQGLMGYPVLTSGLVSMPRGLGSFVAMFLVGQLVGRVDTRAILMTGLSLNAVALWMMMGFDLSMNADLIMISGVIQGLGIGLIFVPLSTLAFATLAPSLRAEGSGVYTLIRNLGSGVGISIMNALVVSNTQTMHAAMAGKINPSDPAIAASLAGRFDLNSVQGLLSLNAEITRQATMVAYVDDFKLMLIITIACMPMLLLMRKPKGPAGGAPHVEVD